MFDQTNEIPDMLDCILELNLVKQRVSELSDDRLIDIIVEYTINMNTDKLTETTIAKFFNQGKINIDERALLENCYVNLHTKLCVDSCSGEILYTFLK